MILIIKCQESGKHIHQNTIILVFVEWENRHELMRTYEVESPQVTEINQELQNCVHAKYEKEV